MAVLPDDIWHIITGKLQFRDLFSFYASHRHAKEIMGDSQVQKLKYWDPIFQDYEWVKAFDSRCQIPMLLFPNKERQYIYLLLGTPTKGKKDKVVKAKMAERGAREAKEALLNTVKKSLRSKTPGRHPCEVQFERFTLNISNVRYDPSPILCKDLIGMFPNTTLELSIYGKGVCIVRSSIFKDKIAFVDIPGFESAIFWDRELDEDIFPGYASTI